MAVLTGPLLPAPHGPAFGGLPIALRPGRWPMPEARLTLGEAGTGNPFWVPGETELEARIRA